MELKDRRIRSNVLSPGPIKTPLVERSHTGIHCEARGHDSDGTHRRAGRSRQGSALPGLDDSNFVTGIELFVDGGRGQVYQSKRSGPPTRKATI